MKRRILIVTNAGIVGAENYCEGVYRDKENYTAFFKSPVGGYYSDSEIKHLDKPSLTNMRHELISLTNDKIDFSILIFCGHGWYSSKSESNIFVLNDNKEEIDSLEFRKGGKKRIIIEDNCRESFADYVVESESKRFSSLLEFSSHKKQHPNPEQCKLYYNKKIIDCSDQILIGMACQIDEFAGDSDTKGGYYSSSLVKEILKVINTTLDHVDLSKEYQAFSFPLSHNTAIPKVRLLSGNKQNPNIEKPRTSEFLPFAIIA